METRSDTREEKGDGNHKSTTLVERKEQEEGLQFMEIVHELRLSAIRGNIEGVKNCINTGICVDQPLRGGWTALMFACSLAHPALVEFLLQRGANPNFHKELFTALMAVCASSQRDQERLTRCVDSLLRYKADPNIAERHHTTALMFAAKQGHVKVVARLLSDPRCKLDAQDSQGWTALFWAVHKDCEEVVKLLVNKGADVNVRDRRGHTVVHISHHDNITKLLTRKHEPPDIGFWSSDGKCNRSKDTFEFNQESKSLVHNLLDELAASIINNNGRCDNKIASVLKSIELESGLDSLKDQQPLVSQISKLISGDSQDSESKLALVPVRKKSNSVEKSLKNFPYSAMEAREMMNEMVQHLEGLYAGMSYVRLHMQGSPMVVDKNARISEIRELSEKALLSSRLLFDEIRFFNQYTKQLEESEQLVPSDYEVERRSAVDKHHKRAVSAYVLATAALVLLYQSKHLLCSLFSKP